jgi:transposase-like protein
MSNHEQAIELTLIAIENGHSVQKVANDYRIPRSTLWNRRRGASVRNSSHHQQRLSWARKYTKHPRDIHESIKQLDNLTRDQRNIFQKAKKALG